MTTLMKPTNQRSHCVGCAEDEDAGEPPPPLVSATRVILPSAVFALIGLRNDSPLHCAALINLLAPRQQQKHSSPFFFFLNPPTSARADSEPGSGV